MEFSSCLKQHIFIVENKNNKASCIMGTESDLPGFWWANASYTFTKCLHVETLFVQVVFCISFLSQCLSSALRLGKRHGLAVLWQLLYNIVVEMTDIHLTLPVCCVIAHNPVFASQHQNPLNWQTSSQHIHMATYHVDTSMKSGTSCSHHVFMTWRSYQEVRDLQVRRLPWRSAQSGYF